LGGGKLFTSMKLSLIFITTSYNNQMINKWKRGGEALEVLSPSSLILETFPPMPNFSLPLLSSSLHPPPPSVTPPLPLPFPPPTLLLQWKYFLADCCFF
jgi:hypothetical protein